jgi:hypothetical protein
MLDHHLLPPPAVANDNLEIIGPDDDPVRVLWALREHLALLRQENARTGELLRCPKARRHYEEGRAAEQALLWWYFRPR